MRFPRPFLGALGLCGGLVLELSQTISGLALGLWRAHFCFCLILSWVGFRAFPNYFWTGFGALELCQDLLKLLRLTWTPKVCKIMAFMAIIMGLGLLFYILLGWFWGCLASQFWVFGAWLSLGGAGTWKQHQTVYMKTIGNQTCMSACESIQVLFIFS